MKNANLTPADQTGTDINWTRKPCSLEEIETTRIAWTWMTGTKFATDYTLDFNCNNPIPGNLQKTTFRCMGEDNKTYLVNPSGYDYPRYVTRIERF